MKYVKKTVVEEIIINKSRFIAQLIPVKNLEDALKQLKEVRKKHYNATHNCYAYLLDNHMIQKMSDDGEPSRTAGLPILETLIANELDNVLCVVTRYYGGVKLGKGGLIRAYKNSTIEAIKKASFYKEEIKQVYTSTMPYNLYELFISQAKDKAFILEEQFLENVTVQFYLIKGDIKELSEQFNMQLTFTQIKETTVKLPIL